ncbi:MAG: 30S ribosomal protein S6 [Candidatus Hydrothermales bacterium]
MQDYEMMLIVDPDIDEEKRKEIYRKIEIMIENEGGKVLDIKDWGYREFAYPIKHKNGGFYSIWEFRSIPETPNFLRSQMRLMKDIFRFMIIKKENVKSFKGKKGG